MKNSSDLQRKPIAACLAIFLAVPFAVATAQPILPVRQAETTPAPQAKTQPSNGTNDSPASVTTQPEQPQTSDQNSSSSTVPSAPEQQQNETSPAVGTAAAPYEKPMGIAASRPAGAVIAPAKQKRAHSFLIRVALVAGAAVAVGTVVGLSEASPSRPR